jgi:hypothetical protein
LLWTSQGRYFARNVKLYADMTESEVEQVTSSFAGVFATCYLGLEMTMKILATVLYVVFPTNAPYIVFTTYALLAIGAVFVVSTVR